MGKLMVFRRMATIGLVLSVIAAASGALAMNAPWEYLFNGNNLDGWKQVNGTAKYWVEDDCIVGETVKGSPNSFLATEADYSNFVLEYEFKISDDQLNSGVQFRSAQKPEGRVFGYQAEIDGKDRAWTAGIYAEAWRNWLYNLEGVDDARNAFNHGDWNRVRIAAVGNYIRTWINDVPAAFLADDVKQMRDKGFIALQVHGVSGDPKWQVRWRHIKIRDLGATLPTTDGLLVPADTTGQAPPKTATVLVGPDAGLKQWRHSSPDKAIAWKLSDDGVLEIVPKSGSIVTKDNYEDFHLHLEFQTPYKPDAGFQDQGNSGIYIQQRYEVQILDSYGKTWHELTEQDCGAIYKTIKPDLRACRPASEWSVYDIVFRSARWDAAGNKTADARITVVQNGHVIHDDVAIQNKTGAGQQEGPAPRPIMLQEHGNAVKFRNVWIIPLDLSTAKGLEARVDGNALQVTLDGRTFTNYMFDGRQKLPFFYPVIGPASGKTVTEKQLDPYPHHSSLWFGCDRVNGANYWQEGNDRGQILSKGPRIVVSERDKVVFTDECVWKRPEQAPDVSDQRRITITAPNKSTRIIDFEITVKAEKDVTVQKTNHSLFSARMRPALSVSEGGALINAEGAKGEKGTAGVPSPWCDFYGTDNGITEGVAIFQNPSNPEAPTPWFTRDYGFMSPTPLYHMSESEVSFQSGETVQLSYRVVVHEGDTVTAGIPALYKAYAAQAH